VYKTNKTGPRTDPWGTPQTTGQWMTWLTRDAHAGVGQIDTTGTIDERYRQYRT